MNIEQQRNHAYSFLISLGMISFPGDEKTTTPTFTKKDTPPTREILNPRDSYIKEKRREFLGYIDLALKKNIMKCKDIREFLLKKEVELGKEMILRTKSGDLISERAFRTCVMEQKKTNKIEKKSVKDQIIDMHRNEFNYIEILQTIGCSERHVIKSLASIGVKVTEKDKSQNKKPSSN